MMEKIITSVLFILLSSWSIGQNLVPNPSFENMNDWNLGQPQIYGEWQTTIDGKIKLPELSIVNANRAAIFLEPYEEWQMKNSRK